MGFFSRDKDPRPIIDTEGVAHSVLYFLWRDDVLDPSGEGPGPVLLRDFAIERDKLCAELFCLRFIGGKMGVVMGMTDMDKRRDICNRLEALQLSMTGQLATPDARNAATLDALKRSFTEHIAAHRDVDIEWAKAVARTQGYLPPFSFLKERIEQTNPILTRHAPDLDGAFREIAAGVADRLAVSNRDDLAAIAYLYLSTWMDMVRQFMPMYRLK